LAYQLNRSPEVKALVSEAFICSHSTRHLTH
jgi:hypothetical protein